jgi:5'-3' exonuclease
MVVSQRFIDSHPYLLVDGSNLLMRLLYVKQKGANLITEPELIASTADWFIQQVSKIVKENCCSGVLVAMDLGGSVRKHALYNEYKANRQNAAMSPGSMQDDRNMFLKELYPKLRQKVVELCRLYNIATFFETGIEADDILGLVAEALNNIGTDCIILSNDSDFLQLCAFPKISCIIPYKKAVVDMHTFPAYFEGSNKKYAGVKIHACEYIFYKSVCGDEGDNIFGIKGVGYKTLHKKKELYFTAHPDMATLFTQDQLQFLDCCSQQPYSHEFEKLISDNYDMIKLNYKLIDLSSRYASASLISESYKLIRRKKEPKPDKMTVIRNFNTLFNIAPNIFDVVTSLTGLKAIYLQE